MIKCQFKEKSNQQNICVLSGSLFLIKTDLHWIYHVSKNAHEFLN